MGRFFLIALSVMIPAAADAQQADAGKSPAVTAPTVTAITVSPFGNWLATAETGAGPMKPETCLIRIWDIEKQEQKWTYPIDAAAVRSLAFSKDESFLHAIDDRGQQRLFAVKEYRTVENPRQAPAETRRMLVDPRDSQVLTIDDQLRLWEQDKAAVSVRSPNREPIVAAEYLANGSHLALATRNQTLLLHPKTLRVLEGLARHQRPVTAFSLWFGPDGLVMFTGHDDGTIESWHAGKKELRSRFQAHKSSVVFVAAYDKGRRCVSAGEDGLLRFWKPDTGERLAEETLPGQGAALFSTSVGSRVIATAIGDDVQVRSIDPSKPSQVGSLWTLTPAESASQTDVATTAELVDPNRLQNWRIARGDWKQKGDRILGAGDSHMKFRQNLPNNLTLKFKLQVHGQTNPRIRFDAFHFGYEGRNKTFFLHGPKATGTPFPFDFDREYAIEIRIDGDTATLLIDGEQVAQSHPKPNDKRTISFEAGGKQSQGSCEFYEIEILLPDAAASRDDTGDDGNRPAGKGNRRPRNQP